MKMTLLDMVQDILNDISSDEINSIGDTIEATQVAQIIKTTYFAMIANMDRPEHHRLLQLEALTDLTKPNYLKLPDNVEIVDVIRYDVRDATDTDSRWADLKYYCPADFLKILQGRRLSDNNIIEVTDFNLVKLNIIDDQAPTMWTSFDDKYVVCDAYDKNIESTLQATKNSCFARITPDWVMEDDFIPDIDAHLFPLLLAEAKSMSFINIKGIENPKVERQARNQKTSMHNDKHRFRPDLLSTIPNYGRRRPS